MRLLQRLDAAAASWPSRLVFDPNGAVRVNGTGGPALHLPSLNLDIAASLVVTAGQAGPIVPTSFFASFIFNDGFDSLLVNISGAGAITRVDLARKNPQSNQSQSCM